MRLVTNDLLDGYDMIIYNLLTLEAATKRRTLGSAEKRFKELIEGNYCEKFEKQNGCPAFYLPTAKLVRKVKEHIDKRSKVPIKLPRAKRKDELALSGIPERLAVLNYCHREVKDGLELRRLIRQPQITAPWLKASTTKLYHYEPNTAAIHCLITSKTDKTQSLYQRCLQDFKNRLAIPNFLHAYVKGKFRYTLLVPSSGQRQRFEQLFKEHGFPDPETIQEHQMRIADDELFQIAIEPVLSPAVPPSPSMASRKKGDA